MKIKAAALAVGQQTFVPQQGRMYTVKAVTPKLTGNLYIEFEEDQAWSVYGQNEMVTVVGPEDAGLVEAIACWLESVDISSPFPDARDEYALANYLRETFKVKS